MQDFITFWSAILSELSGFLLSDPAIWFVGIFLLLAVAQLFKYITSFK